MKLDPRTIRHVEVIPSPDDPNTLLLTPSVTSDVGSCAAAQRESHRGDAVAMASDEYETAKATWLGKGALDHHHATHIYVDAINRRT